MLIPTVIEKSQNGERAYDIYSRLLKDRIISNFSEAEVKKEQDADAERAKALMKGLPADPKRDTTLPLNAQHGTEGPRQIAIIDEAWCIGCTLCIGACPVDCIVGAPKQMHTVVAEQCTGCELCVPACPVDCIRLEPVSGKRTGWAAWSAAQADEARHGQAAKDAGARELPAPVPRLMALTAAVMKALAYRV